MDWPLVDEASVLSALISADAGASDDDLRGSTTYTETLWRSADRATVLSLFNTVMRIPGADGAAPTYLRAGGHYDDVVVTVDGVWKIASRTERVAFAQM